MHAGRPRSRWRALALPVAGLLTAAAVWWLMHASGRFTPVLLPSPGTVLATGWDLTADGSLLQDIVASLLRVTVGYAIGALSGLVLGVLLARAPSAAAFARPVLELLRPVPGIAWIPLAILWFGIGNGSAYFIVALTSFFPVFVTTYDAVRTVPSQFTDLGASLRLGRTRMLLTIVVPAALKRIVTGLQVGLGVAWATVIAAELVAASSGLGYMIMLNRTLLQTSDVMVGIASIGVLGALMTGAFALFIRIALPWLRWAP